MSKFELLARRLALFLGLVGGVAGGCGRGDDGRSPAYSTPDPPAQETAAQLMNDAVTHMSRLRALDVVAVRQLVLNAPEANTCYGGAPCPGSETSPAVAAELGRQVPRLARLADVGARLAAAPETPPADPTGDAAAADLAALDALRIVDIGAGALLTVAPANNPRCYNTPCPEDVLAADTENRRRAGVVHAWATEATAGEGL